MDALVCTDCGRECALTEPIWRCECGGTLDISFTATFDRQQIDRYGSTMWRYRGAIPIAGDNIVSLYEGCTPMGTLSVHGQPIWLKFDHVLPTGSFKDRGASVLVSKVKELGIRHIVEDSSGNAGAAIAAYSAAAGIRCDVYAPKQVSAAKLAQIRAYGANVHLCVNRELAGAQAQWDARGAYYGGHAWNPFFIHGVKTCAFEIVEWLGGAVPDSVVVPVGNGTLLLGMYIGFCDLVKARVTRRMPKLIGVQASQCAPLQRAFRLGRERPSHVFGKPTVADGIAIDRPVRGRQILKAVRETHGRFVAVTELEIMKAFDRLCLTGLYVEPTGAVGLAGAAKYVRKEHPDEVIVTVLTGHGLKAPEAVRAWLDEEA
jgi:threonine synthase